MGITATGRHRTSVQINVTVTGDNHDDYCPETNGGQSVGMIPRAFDISSGQQTPPRRFATVFSSDRRRACRNCSLYNDDETSRTTTRVFRRYTKRTNFRRSLDSDACEQLTSLYSRSVLIALIVRRESCTIYRRAASRSTTTFGTNPIGEQPAIRRSFFARTFLKRDEIEPFSFLCFARAPLAAINH